MTSTFRLFVITGLMAASTLLVPPVQADQPHMFSALGALRNARHQLEMARPDKDGHRERAIQIIDNAIAEVQAGIDAGR